jgi:hypothetical protein
MDPDNCALAARLVSPSYISQGAQALATRRRLVKALLSSRRLPQRGWDEATIEMLLTVGGRGGRVQARLDWPPALNSFCPRFSLGAQAG